MPCSKVDTRYSTLNDRCATTRAQSTRAPVSLHQLPGSRRSRSRFSAVFLNIDLPFQERALLNGDALRGQIASHHRRLSQLHTIGGVHASIHLTLNDYRLGADVGLDISVRPDCQAVVAKLNAAFDVAIHVQVFGSRQLSLDDHRLAEVGELSSLRSIHAWPPSSFSRSVRRE